MKNIIQCVALALLTFLAPSCDKGNDDGGGGGGNNADTKLAKALLVDNSGWELQGVINGGSSSGEAPFIRRELLAVGRHNGRDHVFFLEFNTLTESGLYTVGTLDDNGVFTEGSMPNFSPLSQGAVPHYLSMPFDQVSVVRQTHAWVEGKLVWDLLTTTGSVHQRNHYSSLFKFNPEGYENSWNYTTDPKNNKTALVRLDRNAVHTIFHRITPNLSLAALDSMSFTHTTTDGTIAPPGFGVCGTYDTDGRPIAGVGGRYFAPGNVRDQIRFYRKNANGQTEFVGFIAMPFGDTPAINKWNNMSVWVLGNKVYAALDATVYEVVPNGPAIKLYEHPTQAIHLLTSKNELYLKESTGSTILKWNGSNGFDLVGKENFLAPSTATATPLLGPMFDCGGELRIGVEDIATGMMCLFKPK